MHDLEKNLFELWMDERPITKGHTFHNPSAGARYTDPTEKPSLREDTHFRYPKPYRWLRPARELAWIDSSYERLSGAVGWINPNVLKLQSQLYLPELGRLTAKEFLEVADKVGDRIAHIRYQQEWKSAAELGAIATIIAEQPAAKAANETHCTKVTPHLIDKIKTAEGVLMDLGCGDGGSSFRIIEAIPAEYRHNLTYLAIDVMPDAVKACKERFGSLGVKVVPVVTMAADMDRRPELMVYEGKVDGFVSGACIHQNTNFDDLYRTVHKLMAPRGELWCWDWLHFGWIAPRVRAGENVPETTPDLPGRGVEGVREIYKVWVGLHGFGLSEEEKARGETVSRYQKKLLEDFECGIRNGGFSFNKWLKENLDGQQPTSNVTPFRRAEAHCDPLIYKFYLEKNFGQGKVTVEQMPGTPLLFGFHAKKE